MSCTEETAGAKAQKQGRVCPGTAGYLVSGRHGEESGEKWNWGHCHEADQEGPSMMCSRVWKAIRILEKVGFRRKRLACVLL